MAAPPLPPPAPRMEHPQGTGGGTAVVIGAGMSGLLAARVLTESFARVVVLERHALPDGPEFRRGVPQDRHVHILLARGAEIYERLFPGLRAELRAAGALDLDSGEHIQALFPGGWASPAQSGIRWLLASRPLLETLVRRRTAALDGVEIRDTTQATALCLDAANANANVVGVRVTRPGEPAGTGIDADLVVDASGRSSKLADWLHASGRSRPYETIVDARLGYASRVYEIPAHQHIVPAVFSELLHAPDLPRGHATLRIESNRLLVTLQGVAEHRPPRDESGFTAFTQSLRSPLHEILHGLRPLSPIYRFTHTANRKTAYHRMADWPGGLIAVGDSVCTFNPAYGHGMTVAGIEALLLQDHLARDAGFTAARCRRFQRRLSRVTAWPWLLATSADRGWLEGRRPSPALRCAHWYIDQWLGAIPGDPAMFDRFLRIAHLLAGPGSLVHPAVLARILNRALRGRPPRSPARTTPDDLTTP